MTLEHGKQGRGHETLITLLKEDFMDFWEIIGIIGRRDFTQNDQYLKNLPSKTFNYQKVNKRVKF